MSRLRPRRPQSRPNGAADSSISPLLNIEPTEGHLLCITKNAKKKPGRDYGKLPNNRPSSHPSALLHTPNPLQHFSKLENIHDIRPKGSAIFAMNSKTITIIK
jgi:hypothetical protein